MPSGKKAAETDGNMGDKDDDLELFRNQWKRELNDKTSKKVDDSKQTGITADDNVNDEEDDVHKKARELFMQGVDFEQDGKLYEAVQYYKKAEKLVPNIEYQAYKFNGGNTSCKKKKAMANNATMDDNGNLELSSFDEENEDFELANLCSKFSKLSTNGHCHIQKEFETNNVHIGELPCEVINYIIKWVVSSALDMRALEACSQVCRGFYLAARDEEIWRLASCRVWGPSTINNYYPSWREMFLNKPKVNFTGCYISRMKYYREGERGFQDQETYKAWHVVQYNRYLRFFPGGQVIMALSSDDESIIAKQLNTRAGGLNIQGAILGRYKIVDNVVFCVLHKPKAVPKKVRVKRRGKKEIDYGYEVPDQDFHLEFYISGAKCRLLEWKLFNLVSKHSNGNETNDDFQIRDQNKFPSLKFKHVGSYQFESQFKLA